MHPEDQTHEKVEEPHFPGEIELYGDPGIATFDAKVPKFLLATYIIMPIWGIIALSILWNGSTGGWMDPGYWRQLQAAANTTIPENQNMLQNRLPEESIAQMRAHLESHLTQKEVK